MGEADRIIHSYRDRDAKASARWDHRNPGNQQMVSERKRKVRELLEREGWIPLGDRRLLDVGAGWGAELAWFRDLGASDSQLAGIDLLRERVESAKREFPGIDFREGNAESLPFPDASFDLVLAFTVFSSIRDRTMQANVASEVLRVMRPGGALLWYDFRYDSPANRNVRGMRATRVRELFPSLQGRLSTITLLPPVARRLSWAASIAYPVLSWASPMRSHLMGLLRKPA